MSLYVKYMDVPVGAQEAAAASVSSRQPFSAPEQLVYGAEDRPWVTLEPQGWILDGAGALLPDAPAQIGWWSAQRSGGDGRFAEPPVISVGFGGARYTATGITFRFWPSLGQWCNDVLVTWYDGDAVLAQIAAKPDNAQWVLPKTVRGFDRIEIQLLGTNIPGQFAKLQQLQIGHVIVFMEDELVRVELVNGVDPSLQGLCVDTMTVEIRDRKNRAILPQQNQSIQLYRNGTMIASHYITGSDRDSLRDYRFRCQSAVGRLKDVFLGGVYDAYPLEMLLNAVLAGFAYCVADVFAGQRVTGYLPVCTRQEALQQIAFSLGAAVFTRSDGTICLEPLPERVEAEFDSSNVFIGAKMRRIPQIGAVRVLAHRYIKCDEEKILINDQEVNGDDVMYVFSEPHHSYAITGGRIVASGENWARICAAGTVKLTAKRYIHSTSVHTKHNSSATAAEKSNVVRVEDQTLIHPGNVDGALTRLYAFYEMTDRLVQDAVITGQKAGQKAESMNPWGTVTEGYITTMESSFTQTGHTAKVTILGIEKDKGETA